VGPVPQPSQRRPGNAVRSPVVASGCAMAASGDALGGVFAGPVPRFSVPLPSQGNVCGDVWVFRCEGEIDCFTTRLLSPQFTSCCHGAASFGNGMPYSGGSWRAHASVPHHNVLPTQSVIISDTTSLNGVSPVWPPMQFNISSKPKNHNFARTQN
jgi:hypothetical protein